MKALLLAAMLSLSVGLAAQDPPNPRALFDAGHYQQVIDAIGSQPDRPADLTYLLGHSYLRLNLRDEARQAFSSLSAGVAPDAPTPWSLVGESAAALVDLNNGLAVEKAAKAVEIAPGEFFPNYQLGLAQSAAEQWEPSAKAFEQALTIDPSFAYAHYYAGLAYSRLSQVDRVATHFEYFLKLAPEAPERPAVMSLMRTLRGL